MKVWPTAELAAQEDQYRDIRLNFLEAWESGLWCFVVTQYEIVCLERPAIHHQGDRLHNDAGPAVSWPGEEYYFYRGVQVPDSYVIERPETITIHDIDTERNREVKRIKIERYGYERFMKDGGAKKVAEDETGTLWRRKLNAHGGENLFMVEVVNGSPEPDGTFKHYWLRVPPTVTSAKEAVAWTYRLRKDEYKPKIRT